MKSKFTIKSFLPLVCIPLLLFVLTVYIVFDFDATKPTPPMRGIPLILLLTFTLLWLFFGEFRTKMIRVKIEDSHIAVKKYGGLSASKNFLFSELDGFKISLLYSKGGYNEYLYLMQGNKKICKISDFYHKNYLEMKEKLKLELKDLGVEKFSYWDELKESFS